MKKTLSYKETTHRTKPENQIQQQNQKIVAPVDGGREAHARGKMSER